jgi:hypothetical protein
LERGEPVVVIARTVIGFAPALRDGEFFGERGRPFTPGEEPGLRQRDGEPKSVGFPRFGKYRLRIGHLVHAGSR